jgi:hypothetical protein
VAGRAAETDQKRLRRATMETNEPRNSSNAH